MVGVREPPAGSKPDTEGGIGRPARYDSEGSRLIVVLDTGGIEALTPLDEQRRARLRTTLEHASTLVVPAAVLAEGVFTGRRGHDFQVRRLLELLEIAVVDEAIALAAGRLRRQAISAGLRPVPSGVDAIVAAEADALADREEVRVVTSDPGDLELLTSLGRNAGKLSILAV